MIDNPPQDKNLKAAETVERLVRDYGDWFYDDTRRCKAFLNDTCPSCKSQISALVKTVEDGIVTQMLKESGFERQVLTKVRIRQFGDRLNQDGAVESSIAQWAIITWALALGIYKLSDQDDHKEDTLVKFDLTIERTDDLTIKRTVVLSVKRTSAKATKRSKAIFNFGIVPTDFPNFSEVHWTLEGLPELAVFEWSIIKNTKILSVDIAQVNIKNLSKRVYTLRLTGEAPGVIIKTNDLLELRIGNSLLSWILLTFRVAVIIIVVAVIIIAVALIIIALIPNH
jgi:hypothetical protein